MILMPNKVSPTYFITLLYQFIPSKLGCEFAIEIWKPYSFVSAFASSEIKISWAFDFNEIQG